MMKQKIWLILLLFIQTGVPSLAQQTEPLNPFLEFELSINELFKRMVNAEDDDQKVRINDSIKTKVKSFLNEPASFKHQFDSLTTIGTVKPRDEMFKVYTWNIPYYDGTHDFFGYIQFNPDKNETKKIIELTHVSKKITNIESATITPSNWYGALYYEVVDKKYKGETYYTLLAYNPHDLFTKKKFVDILNIDEHGMVTFGKPVFKMDNQIKHRVVFEYSARVGMMLRFIENMDMIVYDHLSPPSPAYEGRFQYYGPDFSYDGFTFDKGYWLHQKDIQIEY
jgi:hypothetical protein